MIINYDDVIEIDGVKFRVFSEKQNEISIHNINGEVKTIMVNPNQKQNGRLKCCCCQKYFNEDKIFKNKDGKRHLCFKCY